jgi:hypothetical protein
VILPHRAGERAGWTAERLESDTFVGARIGRGPKSTIVAFRKHQVELPASPAGRTFARPVEVW